MKVVYATVDLQYHVYIWIVDMGQKCVMLDSMIYLATMTAIHNTKHLAFIVSCIGYFVIGCTPKQSDHADTVIPFSIQEHYSIPNNELNIVLDHTRLTSQGLIAYDRIDQQIVLIDLDENKVIREFGSGKGRGPGEHEMIFDISVNEKLGRMYALDPRLYRVSEYNLYDGSLISTITVKNDLTRVLSLDENRLLLAPIADEALIKIYNIAEDTVIIQASLEGYETQKEFAMSTIGNWIFDQSSIYYFPVMDSRIFKYNLIEDEFISNSFSTPDTFTFRKSIDMSTDAGVMLRAPARPYVRVGAVKSENHFITASRILDLQKRELVSSTLHVFDSNFNVVRAYDMSHFERDQPQGITANNEMLCIQFNEVLRCYEVSQLIQ